MTWYDNLLQAVVANRLHLPQSSRGAAPRRPSVPSSPSFVLFVVVVVFVFLVYGGMRALERRGEIRQGRRDALGRRRRRPAAPPPRSGVDAASSPMSFLLLRGVVPPPLPPPSSSSSAVPTGPRAPRRIGVVFVGRVVALVPLLGVVIATVVAVTGAADASPRCPHPRVDPPPTIRPSSRRGQRPPPRPRSLLLLLLLRERRRRRRRRRKRLLVRICRRLRCHFVALR